MTQRRTSTRRQPTVRGRSTKRSNAGNGLKMRLVIGLVVAGFAFFSFLSKRDVNPTTGEVQYISLTRDQEIAMGLQAQPQMIQQFGGMDPDPEAQALVDLVGERLVRQSFAAKSEYPFEFTLLADSQTINAFALPGGPIFITAALFNQLETEGQLAGVLGHEIGHVIARHGSQRIAKQELTEGLTGAVVMAACDGGNSCQGTTRMAQMVGNMVNMKYGRGDELQSDSLGLDIMLEAGYNPASMIRVMEILRASAEGASQPEIMSTHPDPGNRIGEIQKFLEDNFPNGVPDDLTP
ncbi:MAG: putative Zn-dependent protease [Cellvibrionaceae bacterium]|jgi:predicted Zn-dependent protease